MQCLTWACTHDADALHVLCLHIQVERQQWQITEMQAAAAEVASHHASTR